MTSSTPLDAKEIRSLMSDLEKAGGSTDKVVSLLTIFDERVQPTEKLLRETKLGIAVNKYRSHSDKKVAELVKKIVKKWKDQVSAQKNTSKSKQSNPASSSSATSSSSTHNNGSHSSKSTSVSSTNSHGSAKSNSANNTNKSGSSVNKSRTPASDGIKTNVLNDRVRDPCIDLLYKALAIDSSEPGSQILECAKDIEEAVFDGENGTTKGYRQKILSLVSNLKDSRNPNLRGRVLSGEISGKVLYNMKPHEMASDDVKKDIEKIKKENLFNAQGAEEKRAVTDRFTCGKCKQKKVSYFQMQTRSADEPLTTFCTCENCGNRWKFS